MFYVYGLFKKNGEFKNELDRLFYVGQTSNLEGRMRKHRSKSGDKRNKHKIAICNKYDFYHKVLFLSESKEDAVHWEYFLIRYYGKICSNTGFLSNILDSEMGFLYTDGKRDFIFKKPKYNEIHESIILLHKENKNYDEIADFLNIQKSTVIKHLKDENITIEYKKERFSQEEIDSHLEKIMDPSVVIERYIEENGLNQSTVYNWRRNRVGVVRHEMDEYTRLSILKMRDFGFKIKEIAECLSISKRTVDYILKINNKVKNKAEIGLSDLDKNKIIESYNKGLSNSEIAKIIGFTAPTVMEYLKTLNLVSNNTKNKELRAKQILNLYLNGLSCSDIVKSLNVPKRTVSEHIKKYKESQK
jgi:DNA-binding CsgD family transcriptional regulator/predicted GIY-YIG superfamily endonuclease